MSKFMIEIPIEEYIAFGKLTTNTQRVLDGTMTSRFDWGALITLCTIIILPPARAVMDCGYMQIHFIAIKIGIVRRRDRQIQSKVDQSILWRCAMMDILCRVDLAIEEY
jgi:hypothetical protein